MINPHRLAAIIDAVAEMRDALDYRIYREDIDDTHLAADCQTWCELIGKPGLGPVLSGKSLS